MPTLVPLLQSVNEVEPPSDITLIVATAAVIAFFALVAAGNVVWRMLSAWSRSWWLWPPSPPAT